MDTVDNLVEKKISEQEEVSDEISEAVKSFMSKVLREPIDKLDIRRNRKEQIVAGLEGPLSMGQKEFKSLSKSGAIIDFLFEKDGAVTITLDPDVLMKEFG